jgi:hypothetical protein
MGPSERLYAVWNISFNFNDVMKSGRKTQHCKQGEMGSPIQAREEN